MKIKTFLFTKLDDLLIQIVNNTEPKRSFSTVASDNKTRFKTWFKPPIQLDKKKDYEIALINLETYYSFPWVDIIIPEGSYHVEDINEFIQREMRKNDHNDKEKR